MATFRDCCHPNHSVRFAIQKPGLMIVTYGVNGLGKSTQLERLVNHLQRHYAGQVHRIKYPIYQLEPSGSMINAFLREGNPLGLSPREAQLLYAFNRAQYQTLLTEMIAEGDIIVAEDYTGTGIAWGMVDGIDQPFLEELNAQFINPDLSLFLDGTPFGTAVEQGHRNEGHADRTARAIEMHRKLATEHGWHVVNGNQSIEAVEAAIWEPVIDILCRHCAEEGAQQAST